MKYLSTSANIRGRMANTSSISHPSSDVDFDSYIRKMEEYEMAAADLQVDIHEQPPDYSFVAGSDHEEDDDENDDDEEEEDEDDIGKRALAYDPNQLSNSQGLPVNGHDFLRMVQEERNRLPGTVTVWPPSCSKKSTQASSTVAMEVLQCGEQLGPCNNDNSHENQENNYVPTTQQSQRSSVHPMETSQHCDTYIDSSDEEEASERSSLYASMASKEFRNMIRLKSLGCTPLDIKKGPIKRPAPSSTPVGAGQSSDLLERDKILANFLKLRQQIDTMRRSGQPPTNGGDSGERHLSGDVAPEENDNADDQERAQDKASRKTEKNLSRQERRAIGLIKIMNLGHAPQASILVHKSQSVIHMTLDKIVEQCEKAPIYSTLHADWIYSLIALLREPIEPDICSTLRKLAKVCMARRDSYERRASEELTSGSSSSYEPRAESSSSRHLVAAINKEEYFACLLIICIVRFHFGQADLK